MISTVIERNGGVYVYNEKNQVIKAIPGAKLHGYTSTTYSVIINGYVYTYDEKGNRVSATPYR